MLWLGLCSVFMRILVEFIVLIGFWFGIWFVLNVVVLVWIDVLSWVCSFDGLLMLRMCVFF